MRVMSDAPGVRVDENHALRVAVGAVADRRKAVGGWRLAAGARLRYCAEPGGEAGKMRRSGADGGSH
jgi:hypothetical protein